MLNSTNQRNAFSICFLLLLAVIVSSWWLFGLVWTLFLSAVSLLSYCTTSYLCYSPEASEWRTIVDGWCGKLFLWYFNSQRNNRNGTPPPPSSYIAPSETRTKSLGGGVNNNPQPPNSQASNLEGANSDRKEGIQPRERCHQEARKLIQLILRDFVSGWYANVTNDTEFPEDVQKLLEHIALEINVRMQSIDLDVVMEMLNLIIPYLEVLNKVGVQNYNGVELFDVTNELCVKHFEADPRVSHHALKSLNHEHRYYRQALDALIQSASPPEYSNCDVACMFIRELLLKNIIEPVLDLLCDPAFLYEAIPLILTKASADKVRRQLEDIEDENIALERAMTRDRLMSITGSRGRPKRRFHTQSISPDLSLSPRKVAKARPNSIATLPYMQKTSSGIYESNSWLTTSSQVTPQHSADNSYPPPSVRSGSGRNRGVSHIPRNHSYHHSQNSEMMDHDGITEEDPGRDMTSSYEYVINSDYAMVELAPIYIERHVRVETEAGSHTAYIFKFPKWMLPDNELKQLEVLESDIHLEGMKRYSDFYKFHDCLLASPLTIYAKGLTLPNKRNFSKIVYKLTFSSEPDTTMLAERREGLEKYLQSVSSVEAIISSDLFHQFLKSAVKDLKEANVVMPSKSKKQNRMSFLGRVRADDTHKAEPVPKRPLESVLSSYLNTHLPLPCRFNTLGSIRKNSLSNCVSTAPMKVESSRRLLSGNGRSYSSSSLQELASGISPANSMLNRSHTISSDTLHHTDHLEHASTVIPENEALSEKVYPAIEAIHDSVNEDDHHGLADELSIGSSQGSLRRRGRESHGEEEQHTIGSFTGALGRPMQENLSGGISSQSVQVPTVQVTFLGNAPPQVTATEDQQVMDEAQINSSGESYLVSKMKSLLYKCLVFTHKFITWTAFIIQQGIAPKRNSHALIKAKEKCSPLANTLFGLGSEASIRHCPELWACCQDTQLALLVLAGGGVERFLLKELEELIFEETNWLRCLYSLRHTLWPEGVLSKFPGRKKDIDGEAKKKAQDAIKKFLPNFLPHVVGKEGYDKVVIHCLDCLRNPRINRHFWLAIVDLLIVKIIPEITDKKFQRSLSQLRTMHSTYPSSSSSSLPHVLP